MKKAEKRRSFWQYNKDNWAIFIPFIMSLIFAPMAFADGAPMIGGFFLIVTMVCVLGSYIDWKRLG
jgi:hypothetical protein